MRTNIPPPPPLPNHGKEIIFVMKLYVDNDPYYIDHRGKLVNT